jgi:acyl-CoA synthetase (NDP forming)
VISQGSAPSPDCAGSDWRRSGLDALFAPARIAVIGASRDPTRIGGRPIQYALAAPFAGQVYPVNPNHTEIQGLEAYPDLRSVPEPVDLVIIALPVHAVAAQIEAAADRGAKAAVIFSSGFAESGDAGKQRQDALRELCRALHVRVLGPNCLGIFNGAIGHTATFASFLQNGIPTTGRIALVSQSGAYASYLFTLAHDRGIGIGKWVTTGNEMDVTLADVIAYLADDESVAAIGCVAEGIRDGQGFLRAVERVHDVGKPFVLLKMGCTPQGIAAAESHTAALAVNDTVLDAVISQAGGLRVATTQDFLDVLYGLQFGRPLNGRRLGIVTVSGGAGVLMVDAAVAHGFSVPPLPLATQHSLKEKLPYGSMNNPVDITAQALNDLTLAAAPIRAMITEGGYDAVAGFFMNWLSSSVTGPKLRSVLADTLQGTRQCTLALAATGSRDIVEEYERQGILVFEDPARAIATLGTLAHVGEAMRRHRAEPPSLVGMPLVQGDEFGEVRAKAILAQAGLQALPEVLVADPPAARAAAGRITGSVALKIVSADLPHKTDHGGVRLGLEGCDAVEEAAIEMLTDMRRQYPRARIDGLLMSPMISDGIEMIVGTNLDATFGPIVMIGFGGIFVDVIRDVKFRYGAIGPAEAHRMIDELQGRRLLDGVRGRPPSDIDALANAVALLSRFGAANLGRLQSAEVNPLVVRPRGKGCVMLDALLTLRRDVETQEC